MHSASPTKSYSPVTLANALRMTKKLIRLEAQKMQTLLDLETALEHQLKESRYGRRPHGQTRSLGVAGAGPQGG